jgi:hypothetical protein
MKIQSLDPLQPGYEYHVSPNREYDPDFKPDFTPAQCLRMGIFGGAYFRGYPKFGREFPHLRHVINEAENPDDNYFGVLASLSRHDWQQRGWMHDDDPRGWFQWYCRYDMGRRHADDDRQISRWVKFKQRKLREIGDNEDVDYKRATRQGLLHWGIRSPGMA